MKKNILFAGLLGLWGVMGCEPSSDPNLADVVDCTVAANKTLPFCGLDPFVKTNQIDQNLDNYVSITIQRPLMQDELLSAKLVQGSAQVEVIFLIDRSNPTELNARVLQSKLAALDPANTSISLVLTFGRVNSSATAQWSFPLTLKPIKP